MYIYIYLYIYDSIYHIYIYIFRIINHIHTVHVACSPPQKIKTDVSKSFGLCRITFGTLVAENGEQESPVFPIGLSSIPAEKKHIFWASWDSTAVRSSSDPSQQGLWGGQEWDTYLNIFFQIKSRNRNQKLYENHMANALFHGCNGGCNDGCNGGCNGDNALPIWFQGKSTGTPLLAVKGDGFLAILPNPNPYRENIPPVFCINYNISPTWILQP